MAEVASNLGSPADELYAVETTVERFRPAMRRLRKCQPDTAF